MPYLRIKRRHAVVMQAFIHHRKGTYRVRTAQSRRLPDSVMAVRERLHRRMKKLNARGVGNCPRGSPMRRSNRSS
jgi:hypothetical protein